MAVKVIGLDTAKNVFQVHGADASGRAVLRKRLRRAQIPDFFANLPKCVVGIEATQGAHYWSRVIGSFGHEVRLIAPQFVKPYLTGQKNDARDAAAICEAISRPEMRFVPQKSIAQQDLQALHRIRSRLIGSRTQLGNQIRGLLAEYGIILPLHLSEVRKRMPELFSEGSPSSRYTTPCPLIELVISRGQSDPFYRRLEFLTHPLNHRAPRGVQTIRVVICSNRVLRA